MARLSLVFVAAAAIWFSAVQANPIEARDVEVVHVATVVPFDRDTAVQKRDMTSAWSLCGVPYGDSTYGACVSSSSKCGDMIYAYIGDSQTPTYKTHAKVVDVCSGTGADGVYFTLASFEQLGGTVASGKIYNVNWKYLPTGTA